ncbi:putative gti1/Pac2 family protein [Lyophyllum shimeji]|uniref:Gti1/Pac2 family protein n=1 Tax=Lyophyllum shimeji TaxID=47721 RepID=A0A9P3PLR8_LYOSH|nr:putative gti1/Pac2 family protein [Lyophyllum shimeji]
MVSRRLDTDERRYIMSGCVFVWEERGPNAEATGLGIERWTDSIRWGPSRVRDEFLYYHEREPTPIDKDSSSSDSASSSPSRARGSRRGNLIKQTYSVFVETCRGRRKWHLIAYFTQETVNYLRTIDDFPILASMRVPPGRYRTARAGNRGRSNTQAFDIASYPHLSYGEYPTLDANPCDHLQLRSAPPPNHACAILAPLEYLQSIPPHRRHPVDEEALMSLAKKPCWIK